MTLAIEWREHIVAVDQLKPFEQNPRTITDEAFKTLKKSLKETGYHQRILATPDLRIIGGHMRIKALQELGIKNVVILTPDRPLTDEEFKRILIQDNWLAGKFDMDILASEFDLKALTDFGLPEKMFTGLAPAEGEAKAKKPKPCPHCGKDTNLVAGEG